MCELLLEMQRLWLDHRIRVSATSESRGYVSAASLLALTTSDRDVATCTAKGRHRKAIHLRVVHL